MTAEWEAALVARKRVFEVLKQGRGLPLDALSAQVILVLEESPWRNHHRAPVDAEPSLVGDPTTADPYVRNDYSEPPTDDEREALRQVAAEAWKSYQEISDDPEFGGDFEDVLAHRLSLAGWRNRHRGPITDAEVDAAYQELRHNWRIGRSDVRAALEAARSES